MTLIVGWRDKNEVRVLSDSRISDPAGNFADVGTKIFSIPIRMSSAISVEDGSSSQLHGGSIGLAFAGNVYQTYIIKEYLFNTLKNIQVVPYFMDASLVGVIKYVVRCLKAVAHEAVKLFQDAIETDILLIGFCSHKKTIRSFKIYFEEINPEIKIGFEEILVNDGEYVFMGSGETEAEKVKRSNPVLDHFHLIKKVIREKQVPSVGGSIQFGQAIVNEFRVRGVQDFEFINGILKWKYSIGGVYIDDIAPSSKEFHLQNSYITPFESDVQAEIENHYKPLLPKAGNIFK